MSFLTIDRLTHAYFSPTSITNALEDITLEVEEGEFVSLLGPSGCGKTTLLSLIAGLLKPTVGSIKVNNEYVQNAQHQIGYMFQQDYLFPWRTIEENILLGLKIQHKLDDMSTTFTLDLLDQLNLSHTRSKYPRELSGGMRQRIALVRTLATQPVLLLLDEPFSALDYQTKLKLENLVFKTLKEHHKTAVLVTHDIGESIAMSDRVVVLSANPGKIKSIHTVPEHLRKIEPLHVRNHPDFKHIFQTIWEELNELDHEN
ncbi:ABC transporter ATP-binding protein [Pseudalkalibacillus berkeleyi]|uniref:ABC transporter ATP-binding protein n=1 Tax=Pseudalkalibacillus berkeleyi TaxID=1069813 RepID=A0ABS9H3E8_9BACL|nr:ABC transporter ATP-binding protein [Pseudalkalibacillus berkeleyi]MCF6138367.1 ABC transporter ATP-binding protein [Pseudalkalibacillus berkeleyi]